MCFHLIPVSYTHLDVYKRQGLHNEWQSKQELANRYVEQALDVYFTRLGKNPFQEGIE